MTDKTFAAIDLGTNSCRLLIADENQTPVYSDTQNVRLGEKMYANMRFTEQAMERGYDALQDFAQKIKEYNCVKVRAIATAACRMAANGAEFVKNVEEKCGIRLEVIDGEEEARLNLKGAIMNSLGRAPYVVVYDLGGGSTEITLATNDKAQKILYTISIPWGARNASEAFGLEEEYVSAKALELKTAVKAYCDDFIKNSNYLAYKDKCCFVATSSSPLRLSAWIHNRGEYVRENEDGQILKREDMDKVIAQIYKMNREERAQSPYIGQKRASVFVAAAVIFKTIYDALEVDELIASLKSAKDGIIAELTEENKNGKINKISQRSAWQTSTQR